MCRVQNSYFVRVSRHFYSNDVYLCACTLQNSTYRSTYNMWGLKWVTYLGELHIGQVHLGLNSRPWLILRTRLELYWVACQWLPVHPNVGTKVRVSSSPARLHTYRRACAQVITIQKALAYISATVEFKTILFHLTWLKGVKVAFDNFPSLYAQREQMSCFKKQSHDSRNSIFLNKNFELNFKLKNWIKKRICFNNPKFGLFEENFGDRIKGLRMFWMGMI